MLPDDWSRRPLVQVAEIRTGVAKGKKGLKDPIEVPYLRVANVQDGHIDLSEVKTIKIERQQLERYSLAAGDVLMTEGGDFDKLGRGDVWHGQISPCLNQNHVFAVRVNKEILTPYFLASLSGSNYGKTYFLSCAKRSTNLASINSTQLKEFPVVIPPLPEQRKIAKILQTWDRAIATTEKLIDASKQQKKALMQQLLTGKKRFAGFEGEWEKRELNDLLDYLQPTAFIVQSTEYDDNYKTPVLTAGKTFILGYTNEEIGIFEEELPAIIFDDFTTASHYVDFPFKVKSSAMKILKGKNICPPIFLFEAMQLLNFTVGGHQRHWISIYSRLVVSTPKDSEARKIVNVIKASNTEISRLDVALNKLKQEKKALMQQLLTGKRRVKVDD